MWQLEFSWIQWCSQILDLTTITCYTVCAHTLKTDHLPSSSLFCTFNLNTLYTKCTIHTHCIPTRCQVMSYHKLCSNTLQAEFNLLYSCLGNYWESAGKFYDYTRKLYMFLIQARLVSKLTHFLLCSILSITSFYIILQVCTSVDSKHMHKSPSVNFITWLWIWFCTKIHITHTSTCAYKHMTHKIHVHACVCVQAEGFCSQSNICDWICKNVHNSHMQVFNFGGLWNLLQIKYHMHRLVTYRVYGDTGTIPLLPLHISLILNRFYKSLNVENQMCELCTFSQLVTYIFQGILCTIHVHLVACPFMIRLSHAYVYYFPTYLQANCKLYVCSLIIC